MPQFRIPRRTPRARLFFALLLAVPMVQACTDQAPSAPVVPSLDATNGTASGDGEPRLRWLAPLGSGTADPTLFDTVAAPVVEICAWTNNACSGTLIARFRTTPAGTDETLVVNTTAGQYEAGWSLVSAGLTTRRTYRIRVLQGATQLGAISVDVVRGRWAPTRVDGTLAPLASATALPIRFSLRRTARLLVVFGLGVTGSPVAGTTTYSPGERVAYDFRALPGYRNVGVLLDGSVAAASGEVLMGADHALLISADRIPVVSVAAQPLVPLAEDLLRATDPTSIQNAARSFRVAVSALYQTVGVSEARRQLAEINAQTFDPVRDSSALRRFTQALESGPSTVFHSLSPAAMKLPMFSGAQPRAESGRRPTTVIYVNGILTTPTAFAEGFVEMQAIATEAALAASNSDVSFVPFFNASWWAPLYSGPFTCVLAASTGLKSLPSQIATAAACAPAPLGPLEVATQYAAALSATPSAPVPRAATLADTIQSELASGRSVLVVAHSQGNLMAQQALRSLDQTLAAGALACVAVTSIAPPVSVNWPPVPRDGLFAHGTRTRDILLDVLLPTPDGAKVPSDVTDAADARVEALFGWVHLPTLALSPEAALIALGTEQLYILIEDGGLHNIVTSYAHGDGTREYIRGSIASGLQELDDSCGDGSGNPGPMINGLTYNGHLKSAAQRDAWTFTAGEGDFISVGIGGTAGDPEVHVLDPTGQAITAGYAGGTNFLTVEGRAGRAGTYTILVGAVKAGDYRLTLGKGPGPVSASPDDQGGAMVNGLTYSGALYAGDIDTWTFEATEGDFISVGVGGAVGNPVVRVVDPTGQTVVYGYAIGRTSVTVEGRGRGAGTYTVFVTAGGTGNYRLTLGKGPGLVSVSPDDQGGSLVNGLTYLAALYAGDIDTWTFEATEGDFISVGLGGTVVDPVVRVVDPTGQTVAYGYAIGKTFVMVEGRARGAGIYTVLVTAGGTGDYRLTLGKGPGQVSVSPDDQGGALVSGRRYSGALYAGDIDTWTFTAGEGDFIAIDVGGTTGDPVVRVVDPTGNPVIYGYSIGSTFVTVNGRAGRAGTYTVLVSAGGSGDYELTLTVTRPPN